MILILAESTDPWAMLVHKEAQHTSGDVFWIQPAQLIDRILLNWPVVTGASAVPGTVVIDGQTIPLVDLTGIFARLRLPPPLELEELPLEDRDYVIKETSAAWLAFFNAMPCAVVNRPIPGGQPTILAGSPFMSQLAKKHGFFLPSSCCTSSQADAMLQFSAWSERVYLKPLGSHEPGMFLQAHDGFEQICRVMERRAVSMQAIPHGQRVTVYVVGEEIVATVLQPSADVPQRMEMPLVPVERCLGLIGDLGLTFAECQFIVTTEGPIYCLDVSSAPEFRCCPQEVQPQIVCRLVEYLSEVRSLSLHDSLDGSDRRSSARECLCETRSPQR
ncbi:MAG: hypothetical protein ABI604_08535 [Nitrospirota bacterium]